MTRRVTPTIVVCAVAGAVAVLGLFRPGTGAPTSTPDGAEAAGGYGGEQVDGGNAPAAARIEIEGFAFDSIAVAPGTAIDVANLDREAHTMTSEGGFFDSTVAGGDVASLTAPTVPGSYPFFCAIHPSMTGRLTVQG